MTTDATWRCAGRDVARRWAGAGGEVWVGEWEMGVTYPDNAGGDYCTSNGTVCHEDDIFPTFDTAASASTSVSALENQINTAWISFITTLNPNPNSSKSKRSCPTSILSRSGTEWKAFTPTSGAEDVMPLGGGVIKDCPPDGFWGGEVEYDWQLYG